MGMIEQENKAFVDNKNLESAELAKKMIEKGGKEWVKNAYRRVYFDAQSLANFLGYKLVENARFANELPFFDNKSTIYYDVNNEVYYTNKGFIATALRVEGWKVKRI